ncbi:MAG: hypothetical protein WC989_09655 [Micavibrio sp.]
MSLIGFIPCRAGSERVVNKNTCPFSGYKSGLLELKLQQLHLVGALDRIIVSSNDERVLEFSEAFSKKVDSRVEALPRPDKYGQSSTSMEAFIKEYISGISSDGHIFWTHVTHPFVTSCVYNQAIEAYQDCMDKGFDCLVSATKLQRFLWKNGKPFNYDNRLEKWPRSQDLEPVYEINHAIYAIPFSTMRKEGDRIGKKPYFFEMDESVAMDIDWEDQFRLMDEIAQARLARGMSLL